MLNEKKDLRLKAGFPSDSEAGVKYVVDLVDDQWFCNCPAFKTRGPEVKCKHILRWMNGVEAMEKASAKETAPDKYKKVTKPRHGTEENPVTTGGYYDFGAKKRFPRVTSILNASKQCDGLIGWAAKTGGGAVRESYDRMLGNIIKEVLEQHQGASQDEIIAQITNRASRETITIEEAKLAPHLYKIKKARIGTKVHNYLELFNSGDEKNINDLPSNARGYAHSFFDWLNHVDGKNTLKTISQETPVYSKKHKYAGTFDWLAEFNGRTALLDFKTSNHVFEDVGLQLIAYKTAIEEMGIAENVQDMIVIHLMPDGSRAKEIHMDEPLEAFLAMHKIWEWRTSIDERRGGA